MGISDLYPRVIHFGLSQSPSDFGCGNLPLEDPTGVVVKAYALTWQLLLAARSASFAPQTEGFATLATLRRGVNGDQVHQKESRAMPCFLFGGPDGSRTRVRKPLDMNFSGCIPFFEIPLVRRQRTDFTRR